MPRLFRQHTPQHDQSLLLTRSHRVLRILDGLPFARLAGQHEIAIRKRLQGSRQRGNAGEHCDAAHAALWIAHHTDAGARLQPGCQAFRQRSDGDGRDLVSQRIAAGLILRPSHGLRQTCRERVGLMGAPVVGKPEHHQSVLLNEFFLRENHRILGADAGHPASPGG